LYTEETFIGYLGLSLGRLCTNIDLTKSELWFESVAILSIEPAETPGCDAGGPWAGMSDCELWRSSSTGGTDRYVWL
jgi:hypothetical protein